MADLVYDYAKISALVGDWQASIARLQQLLDEQRAEVNKLALKAGRAQPVMRSVANKRFGNRQRTPFWLRRRSSAD